MYGYIYKTTNKLRSKQQSERMLGHKMDNNTKSALYKASKGSKRTEEQKQKMKDVWKQTHNTNKMNFNTNSGRKCMYKNRQYKHSELTKQKISLGNKGKPKSEEHKLKISKGVKEYYKVQRLSKTETN